MSKPKIKNLIVCVDLSNYSRVVVREAKELSHKLKIVATYIYVFQDATIFDETFNLKKREVSKYYEKEIRRKYSLNSNENIIICYGKPYEEIITVAKRFADPMILAGHRGHNVFVRFFLGSTAERLALNSPFPVWIHRGNTTVIPKKILVPCDLNDRNHPIIPQINSLKRTFKASIEFFYVIPEPIPMSFLDIQAYSVMYDLTMKAESNKVRSFKKRQPGLKTVHALGSVVFRIQERSKSFDLIALSPRYHKKSVPFFGSVTTKLLRSGNKPILIIPQGL